MKSASSSAPAKTARKHLFALGLLASLMLTTSPGANAAGQRSPYAIRGDLVIQSAQPSANARFSCELRAFAGTRLFCYGPAAIRSAYGVSDLIAKGWDGSGQTIVIIDAYGSPTALADLKTFDAIFGLPDPQLEIVSMPGLAPFDYTDGKQLGWAEETSLDLQWSHAIAPGAKLVLIAAASNSDVDLLAAQEYAISHYPGAAVSESYGESEYGLLTDPAGPGIIANDEASYARAKANRNAVFVSAGDNGATDGYTDPVTGLPLVPFAVASYPASSPNVTSVGGTNLFFGTAGAANPNGSYLTEAVWNDGFGAGGGGISMAFTAPAYQTANLPAATLGVLAGHRGYPDVSYNAGVVGGVIAHLGFLGASSGNYIFGGTSAGAPQWAGISAIISQIKGRPAGNLNDKLYALGAHGDLTGTTHDIVAGQNGFNTVQGYPATPAWDISTGWGSPSAGLLRQLADH